MMIVLVSVSLSLSFLKLYPAPTLFLKTTQTKASVNAKRTNQGKPPLYDYHCLTVTTNRQSSAKGQGTGTHASPRQHLRRGHIRRLPDKKVWVNSCVVGSYGKICEDYRLI